jgi:hypothetical protein
VNVSIYFPSDSEPLRVMCTHMKGMAFEVKNTTELVLSFSAVHLPFRPSLAPPDSASSGKHSVPMCLCLFSLLCSQDSLLAQLFLSPLPAHNRVAHNRTSVNASSRAG